MKKIRRVLIAVHPHFRPDRVRAGATEADVWSALKRLGYVTQITPVLDELDTFARALVEFKPDIVFNLVEEFRGEAIFDFHLVTLLESKGIPFTGCNPRGLVISRNKFWVGRLAAACGLSVPKSRLAGDSRAVFEDGPFFVKFNREHASLGINQANRVGNPAGLKRAIARMKDRMDSEILVQEFIPGIEVTVSVWGNGRPEAFHPWQLHLRDRDGFATARVKFSASFRKKKGIRATRFNGSQSDRLKKDSLNLFRVLDLSGYARFDYRITKLGEPYLIDVNPNPNLARTEDFACSGRSHGLEYPQLIEGILQLGLKYRPRG